MSLPATTSFASTQVHEGHSNYSSDTVSIGEQLNAAERSLQNINARIAQLLKGQFPVHENVQNYLEDEFLDVSKSPVYEQLTSLQMQASRFEQRVANLQNRLYTTH